MGFKQDFPPEFEPEPTVFSGGLDRMIKIWEAHRDANDGGYGSGIVCSVSPWSIKPNAKTAWTSCSPFTATAIGAMFDPSGGDGGKTFHPVFDNGRAPLPHAFYSLHQGNYFNRVGAREWFTKLKLPKTANCAAGSIVLYNLGYEIDPRDMRRGDFVGINWGNKGGHATFCWDVHLNDKQEVDAFLYLSANGYKKAGGGYGGVGVSVGTVDPSRWVTKSGSKFTKQRTIFEDHEDYIRYGAWMCLPAVKRQDVDLTTFKDPTPPKANIKDSTTPRGHYVASLRVVRFWGFPPPENPHGNKLSGENEQIAHRLAKWPSPPSYATGRGTPSQGRIEKPPVKKQPKSDPDPVKATPPAEAPQQKQQTVGHQMFVETALKRLFDATWIDTDPGIPDNVADAQSKAAIKDFQAKWKLDPDGHAGKKTRAALRRAIEDLEDGKPNPHQKKQPEPKLKAFYWLSNKVEPGGSVGLAVTGRHLDEVKSYSITLSCKTSGKQATVTARIVVVEGHGRETVTIPDVFGAGSALTATINGTGANGSVSKSSNALLYVRGPLPSRGEWPWDEAKWPSDVRDIVAKLRAAPRGSGRFQQRQILQYGVWDNLQIGDTPVLDNKGRELGRVDKQSLYLADLEGTMRLDGKILNLITSGNVFDPKLGRAPIEKFAPNKSRWVDVMATAPWGMGARMPLIPFRTLAHNPRGEAGLYGKKVFIEQLAGMKLPSGETHNGVCIVGDAGALEANTQFDLFVGPESNRISLPALCNVEILG
jgi:hypothetical protein